MKTIYAFPALALSIALFSGACDKTETTPSMKKGSSPSMPPAKEAAAKPAEKAVSEKNKIEHMNAAQAGEALEKDPSIVIIDVRTPGEYARGHIRKSLNIDFSAGNFAEEVKKLDTQKTYLVHCQAGGRSTSSLEVFKKLGFKHIIHLDGGMGGWEDEKLPVVQ